MSAALIRDFPEDYKLYSLREYRYNNISQSNRNRLLWIDPHVDGMKTGHTDAAGWCLIASAKRGDRRLLAVVLGAASDSARAAEAQKLLNWGFTAYEDVRLFDANQPVVAPPVWKGTQKTAKLGRTQPIVLSVPAGTSARIRTQVSRPDPLLAPLARGQQVGSLRVSSGDQQLLEVPLVSLEDVEQAGVLSRAWDALRLWVVK